VLCPHEAWSRRPDSPLPGWTIQIVSDALRDAPRLRWQHAEIFVQGSYQNETNIDEHSDVDLVIQLPMPFEDDITGLGDEERRKFFLYYGTSVYGWEEFKEDVIASLRRSFFVRVGDRCVTLRDFDSSMRVKADVLVAIEYRRYTAFPDLPGEIYDEGVFFRTEDGTRIINYPKIHFRNGNEKDRRTAGRYKQIVRIAKNARLEKNLDLVEPNDAPSYFVECLLYRIPNHCYLADLCAAYQRVVTWLDDHVDDLSDWLCQNEIVKMFGEHPEAWDLDSARRLIRALHGQLSEWECTR
jgi:hypothetical protein